jgi:ABC-2 type transport system ATP-binding protein
VKVTDGSRAAVDVIRALDAEHLDPVTLMIREPTLDDVFLTLTGHKAEEDAA